MPQIGLSSVRWRTRWVSAILKLTSVFGNTHLRAVRAVRFRSELSVLQLVAIPACGSTVPETCFVVARSSAESL
jgi:hypothetical protein